MKHIEKICKITQVKKDFKVMQKALNIIEKYNKYNIRYSKNELHLFDKQTNNYILTIGITDFDELVLYILD